MSAPPQRRTDALTGCQLHPSSEARSLTGRPRPAWRVAQRPARAVSRSRGGAISRSCSVTVPAGHPRRGQRHRRLCNTSRAGRPNAGRSTNSTGRSPSDHNRAPQSPQSGLGPRRRMWTRSGSQASSSTPSTSTSPNPTSRSHMREGPHSTGILQSFGRLLSADSGGSLAFSRGPSFSPLRPQTMLLCLSSRDFSEVLLVALGEPAVVVEAPLEG